MRSLAAALEGGAGCRVNRIVKTKNQIQRSPDFGPNCPVCDPFEHRIGFRATQTRREFPLKP